MSRKSTIRKGGPCLVYEPDRDVPRAEYLTDRGTGTWRLGRITARRAIHGDRIVHEVDGKPVHILDGWTHTLITGTPYAVVMDASPRPLDVRRLQRELTGHTWPDGAAARADIERYMEPGP